MSDFRHIAEGYIAVWNETDPTTRRKLIAELFTEHMTYTDPLAAVRGWEGIDQLIAGVQTRFADSIFRVVGNTDGHHDTARFTWHLGAPCGGDPLAVGFDVVTIDDGLIDHVYGFLDKVPS